MAKISQPISKTVTQERHLVSFQASSPIGGEYVVDATFCHRQVDQDGNVLECHNESLTVRQADIFAGLPNAASIVTSIRDFLHAEKDKAEAQS